MLVFDFDGVLVDSVRETAVTAYNAVTGKTITRLDRLPAGLYDPFRRNRHVARSAPELFSLMGYCLDPNGAQPGSGLTRGAFEALLAKETLPPDDRAARFFWARGQFLHADRSGWLALNAPFQPLWNRLRERGGDEPVILTNKNRAAVLEICRRFDLTVSPENIYGGDDNRPKTQRMTLLDARFQDRPYTFIDDALQNLVGMDRHFNGKETVIRPVLARWGYLGPDDVDDARRFGYDVFDQEDLTAIL